MKKSVSTSQQNGISLIELMIVVAIVGILGGLAYPSYMDSITDARRTDAQAVLMEAAQYMERFYTENNRNDEDTGGTAVALPAQLAESPKDSGAKFYDLSVQASTRSTYTLRATPKNGQAGDGFLEITNTFVKAWDSNNNSSLTDAERTWRQH